MDQLQKIEKLIMEIKPKTKNYWLKIINPHSKEFKSMEAYIDEKSKEQVRNNYHAPTAWSFFCDFY